MVFVDFDLSNWNVSESEIMKIQRMNWTALLLSAKKKKKKYKFTIEQFQFLLIVC